MVDNIKQQLNVLSNALRVRNQKQEILASNIANAATPHFKARDIDFDSEMRKKEKIGSISVNPSVDGNTVELAVEQMEFAENAVRYQTTLDFINSKVRGLMGAIRGE